MPKDDRLFAPFPIEMDEHPKIIGLSDAAFRAVFEATFYSRRMLSDGFLDERVVLKRWGQAVADELSSNDPERPSWVRVDRGWRIHDFEKHHPLRAEIEAKRAGLSEIRSEAGSKGAAKRWQTDSKTVANDSSETETETQSKTNRKASVQAALERDFDEFWKVYPRKEGKQAAKRKYMTARKSHPADVILKGAQAYALMSLGKERKYIKLAQGWLNDGRWDADYSQPVATSPLAPRSLEPAEHAHKWLADGSCMLCTARRDREDTW
jgi:hypothetical protein